MNTVKNIGVLCFSISLSVAATAGTSLTDIANSDSRTVNHHAVERALASTTEYRSHAASGFKWGQSSTTTQSADSAWASGNNSGSSFKWGSSKSRSKPQSTLVQASYDWATSSAGQFEQAGVKWKNTTFVKQAGLKWTNKGYAEQAGLKWTNK